MARCRFIECRRTIERVEDESASVNILDVDGVMPGSVYGLAARHLQWDRPELDPSRSEYDPDAIDLHPERACEPLVAITVELHPGQIVPGSGDLDWSWCQWPGCQQPVTFLVAGEVEVCMGCVPAALENRLMLLNDT